MARNLHAEITSRILDHLKKGTIPWKQPWSSQGANAMPRNAVTGRAYNGVNVPLLWMTAQERGYSAPRWLTFKQAIDAGGNVRRGEKGTTVVFVSAIEKVNEETGRAERVPFLKAFTVFNVAQCENLRADLEPPASLPQNSEERCKIADEFVMSTGAEFRSVGARAFYASKGDYINLPTYETFKSASAFYATTFHELTHWTGHESRCNRQFGKRFGDRSYSAEELVAELGSAFVCAEFGFDNETTEDHAAYIAHWIKFLEEHDKAFVAAASAASRAVEFMRGLALESREETPLAA